MLDACKTCGGSVIDPAKCLLPSSGDTINTAAIIGASVGGCFVVVVVAFVLYKRKQKMQRDASVAFETKPPQAAVIAPPSEPQLLSVVAAFEYYQRKQSQKDAPVAFETTPPETTVIAPPALPQPDKTRPIPHSHFSTTTGASETFKRSVPLFKRIVGTSVPHPSSKPIVPSSPHGDQVSQSAAVDTNLRDVSPERILPGSPV